MQLIICVINYMHYLRIYLTFEMSDISERYERLSHTNALIRIIMRKSLVLIKGENVFTDSDTLAHGLNMEHRSVISLIKTYQHIKEFKEIKTVKRRVYKKEVDVYILTELQATILISFMKNTSEVIDFKIKLVNAFYNQRRLLHSVIVQKHNQEWLSKRMESKEVRKELTDMIQEFIQYAHKQGSKSASHYYSNISRMELTGLFLLEDNYPNAREVMNIKQLNLIEMADEAIARALKEGMDNGLHYKECYLLAKDRIKKLAEIFPTSPLPALLNKPEEKND